ncbi:MAG: DUF6468 domain-containing protein [Pseudomonadota bacterium]
MNIAMTTNILTMVLCIAVLVQSVRMMRSLRTVKDGALTQVVDALEKATAQARSVLSDMKTTLGRDCAENARLIDEAKALRDELSVMIGIADSTAERIVEAVSAGNRATAVAEQAAEPALRDDIDSRDDDEAAVLARITEAAERAANQAHPA